MPVTIIRRAQWGARGPNGCAAAPLPAREVWLHHSATLAPDLAPPFDDDDAAVRTLERIGQDRFGCGISYTWPITPAGRVYEGHGVDRQGTHTGGHNDAGRAICFVGNYQATRPTEAQINAAAAVLQHAHARGWISAPRLAGGHRDVAETACPGNAAYAVIAEINRRAAGGPVQVGEDDLTEAQARQLAAVAAEAATARGKVEQLVNLVNGRLLPALDRRPESAEPYAFRADTSSSVYVLVGAVRLAVRSADELGMLGLAWTDVHVVPADSDLFALPVFGAG
jgi:hypothetical protein